MFTSWHKSQPDLQKQMKKKPFEWQKNVIMRMLEPLTPHLSQGQV